MADKPKVGLCLSKESQLYSERCEELQELTQQGDMWSLEVYFRKILWQQLEGGLERGVAAGGSCLDGCGQTGTVTHAGNEEGRSLGTLSNP